MASITTRATKGSALTPDELDNNFTSLNTEIAANLATVEAEIEEINTLMNSEPPKLVAQLYSPVTRVSDNVNDATFVVIASITIPGGLMGPNSKLVLTQDWDFSNDGTTNPNNSKTLAIDWGGENVAGPVYTTAMSVKIYGEIINANSVYSQRIMNATTFNGTQPAIHISKTKDTTADVVMDFKVKWGANNAVSQYITLLGYSIWHYPGNTF